MLEKLFKHLKRPDSCGGIMSKGGFPKDDLVETVGHGSKLWEYQVGLFVGHATMGVASNNGDILGMI